MSWHSAWAASLKRRLAPLLTIALLIGGCATPQYQAPEPLPALKASESERQQQHSLLHRLEQQQRLSRVGWPLLNSNTELCGQHTRAALGIHYANSHSFGEDLRDSALRQLKLGDALQVLAVVPNSPAEQAGIEVGDRLVALNAKPFASGKIALSQAPKLLQQQLQPDQPARLRLYRPTAEPQRQNLTLTLTPVKLCDYPLRLIASDRINAFADNRRISVTNGMLGFADSDRDLALVIAHELAHNLLGHIPATIRNGLIGGGLDLLLISQGIPSPAALTIGGASSYSQAFETEADYVSLYLLARAGYPLDGSASFWRRMSRARPEHIGTEVDASHPGSAERFLRMDAAIEQIQAKQQRNEALLPNSINEPTNEQ